MENKRYCVSCKSDLHASWAHECPEFLRKCEEYNGYHPENKLIYFPTDEDWMLTTHPERIPFKDKFPEHFCYVPAKTSTTMCDDLCVRSCNDLLRA